MGVLSTFYTASVRGVAQPGSASGLGPEGRRFESCRPDHFKSGELSMVFAAFFVFGSGVLLRLYPIAFLCRLHFRVKVPVNNAMRLQRIIYWTGLGLLAGLSAQAKEVRRSFSMRGSCGRLAFERYDSSHPIKPQFCNALFYGSSSITGSSRSKHLYKLVKILPAKMREGDQEKLPTKEQDYDGCVE